MNGGGTGEPVALVGVARDNSTFYQAGRDIVVLAPPAGPASTVTLPPDPAHFVGRTDLLDRLIRVLTAPQVGSVRVCSVTGMPGVGKTSLAVHLAHRVKRWYPDRCLFADLHGHTPGRRPATSEDVLVGLLAAEGIDRKHLPDDLPGLAALWRDRTATKRVLLVLDNARSSEQIEPLLPAGPDSTVLVTSRRHLGDLTGTVLPVSLGTLSPEEARSMFDVLTPDTAYDPSAVRKLVALCGGLPLAVALVARVGARHPSWQIGHLIAETSERLLTLRAESRTVAAAFELSYRDLPLDLQRFLRALTAHPGEVDSVGQDAAAALAGVTVAVAAGRLDQFGGRPPDHRDRLSPVRDARPDPRLPPDRARS